LSNCRIIFSAIDEGLAGPTVTLLLRLAEPMRHRQRPLCGHSPVDLGERLDGEALGETSLFSLTPSLAPAAISSPEYTFYSQHLLTGSFSTISDSGYCGHTDSNAFFPVSIVHSCYALKLYALSM